MLDQYSPAAPARVRVVLFPIGQIKRSRFADFVERLQLEHTVHLGDISPDVRPHLNLFSPLAFPMGMIVYDLTTFYPSDSCIALSIFELHREPTVIIGLADAAEINNFSPDKIDSGDLNEIQHQKTEIFLDTLDNDLRCLKDKYPKALVHKALLFDYAPEILAANQLPEDIMTIPPPEKCKRTTLKTVMCDISSRLLADMTLLVKLLQESISSSSLRQGQDINWNAINQEHKYQSSRRNSEDKIPGNLGESPSRISDRSQARKTMPIFRKDSNDSRPSPTYIKTRISNSFRSSNSNSSEITTYNSQADSQSNQRMTINRFHSASSINDKTSAKNSILGFGSGSPIDHSNNIEKCRKFIVVGSIYMLAGRWPDALKELAEGATIAKNILHHLWHAKALENILVSILMLAWCGLNFQIPQVCYASAEKAITVLGSQDAKSSTKSRMTSLQHLKHFLPEFLERILNTYSLAANKMGEVIPQISYSESVIRFSKLLTAVHLNGGLIDDDVLKFAVLGIPMKVIPKVAIPRLQIRPTRSEIVAILFQAFPSTSLENLPITDRTIILSSIASVLDSLGYRRKRALVIRELVSHLIHGLVRARIKGAAEIGVHPVAGLVAPNFTDNNSSGSCALELNPDDVEVGIDTLLRSLGQSYGVVSSSAIIGLDGSIDDSDEAVISRILQNASTRAFGNYKLKIDVLLASINMSEALLDFHGLLNFTVDLLRTVGSGVAPGPRSQNTSPSMNREEQLKLASNISRTLGAARNLGIKDLETEYWDEFLLRGIELEPQISSKRPILHKRSELPGVTLDSKSTAINPFIYNPFLRIHNSAPVDHLLVADEFTSFKVTLQNPFEFDIEIESLTLESEGVDYDSAVQKSTIGPYRTQTLNISGIPKESGQLKITGCNIKVRGCRRRRFPIFADPWSPQRDVKIRTIGIASLFQPKELFDTHKDSATLNPPKTSKLMLNVIKKQPVVVVKSTTLLQSSIALLEGETKTFSITLQNFSTDTPADLLLFSFKDSTEGPLKEVLKKRESAAAEQYECELTLSHKPALRWIKNDDNIHFISPSDTATFNIEVLGKSGLSNALIQIDYAYLGVPVQEVVENFHTRQISLPITITVKESVQLLSIDILPLSGNIPRSMWTKAGLMIDEESSIEPEDYCLLLLDLKNAWSDQLTVDLSINGGGSIEETIPSGITKRLMFPMRRIFVKDTSASIPSLDPSRQRQFIVSADKTSDKNEKEGLEVFWYREELLKVMYGSWYSKANPLKYGDIELRPIKLTLNMIKALRVDELAIKLSVGTKNTTKVELYTDTFAVLKIKITNKTSRSISSILRLQPSIRNQPQHLALDLGKRLMINGLLQQRLPIISGAESIEIEFSMIALGRGEYEINALVEETHLFESEECRTLDNILTNEGSYDINKAKALAETKERRIWYSKKPLVIFVRDKDSENDDE
ncbi:Transport protein particle subunit trs120 [Golovinomyces cichoracearum]|uniref:Transport protein particle subunit trs120 n=1 Tax=Golovinomyces cichoracearum TaxID=62708 RepID=A0A420IFN7_9PEZI|nr:Transport protein particle subunit trs120 [Golovinomyces cichoracearum]